MCVIKGRSLKVEIFQVVVVVEIKIRYVNNSSLRCRRCTDIYSMNVTIHVISIYFKLIFL